MAPEADEPRMQKVTDWAALWRELVEVKARGRGTRNEAEETPDLWGARAREYDESVRRRWTTPDSSRRFVLSRLRPDDTVLDIGAGTGSWSALLARGARRVTAVEPSAAMTGVMRRNLTAEGISNVEIVQGAWPEVAVDPHDVSLCSHAMYGYPDLPVFVRTMIASTRRLCVLILRAPSLDGVLAEAARHIWGQPLDSPNFAIAYNVLLQMGLYPSVLMEDAGLWNRRPSETPDEALASLKRHFGLRHTSRHDQYLQDLLRRRLDWRDGRGTWPREVRSALVYWEVGAQDGRRDPEGLC
jgi:2-polyprenyl-3-methyl-5-hydroxy-6-metoxy-1,4-benzoquinol methylase